MAESGCDRDRRQQPRGRARAAGAPQPADAGHYLALRKMAVAYDPLVAIFALESGVLGEEHGNLGLDRLGEQSLRAHRATRL